MALCVPVSMPSGSATVACGAFYLILQKGSSISDPWPTPLKPFEPKRLLEMHLDWALHVLERGQGAGQTVCFCRNLMPPTLSFVRPAGQERLVTAYWGDQTAWTLHLRWYIFHTPSDDTTEKQNQPSTDPYHVLILWQCCIVKQCYIYQCKAGTGICQYYVNPTYNTYGTAMSVREINIIQRFLVNSIYFLSAVPFRGSSASISQSPMSPLQLHFFQAIWSFFCVCVCVGITANYGDNVTKQRHSIYFTTWGSTLRIFHLWQKCTLPWR